MAVSRPAERAAHQSAPELAELRERETISSVHGSRKLGGGGGAAAAAGEKEVLAMAGGEGSGGGGGGSHKKTPECIEPAASASPLGE